MSDLLIETPRLYMRSMELSDLDGLLKIFGDAKVMASLDTEPFNHKTNGVLGSEESCTSRYSWVRDFFGHFEI